MRTARKPKQKEFSMDFNTAQVTRVLESITKDSKTLIKYTMSDYKRKAKTIAKEGICEVYNVKKGQVFGSSEKSGLGTLNLKGSLTNLALEFKGLVLRPMHFSMKPNKPPANEKPYTLTQTVYKGKTETIGQYRKPRRRGRKKGVYTSDKSPVMLFHRWYTVKAYDKSHQYIPGHRTRPDNRNAIKSFTTTSLAGMVRNENVEKRVMDESRDYLLDRLQHHYNRLK